MPLGNQLGADNDVRLSGGDQIKLGPQLLHPVNEIAGENNNLVIRPSACRLFGNPLDTRPTCHEAMLVTTLRASGRHGL